MRTSKTITKNIRMLGCTMLATAMLISSCKKKNSDTAEEVLPVEDPTVLGYTLVASIGSQEYTLTSENIMSGKITVVGKGLETQSYGIGTTADGYFYNQNFSTAQTVQYKVSSKGIQQVASLSNAALGSPNGWRSLVVVENGKLMLMTWPDADNKVSYALVKIPEFTVESNGSFIVPEVGGFQCAELGGPGVVAGGKIYLGAMYTNVKEGKYDRFPDSLLTWRMDYPSFTNPTLLVSRASLGDACHYVNRSMVKDENGDIYQQNIRSKHWYNLGTREDKPTVFVRLKDGQYDSSYVFNISEKFTEKVSIIGFVYVGNGIAYSRLHYEDQATEWNDAAESNKTAIVKIDLYNKTVLKMNLPLAPYIRAAQMAVYNGKVYVPVSPVGAKSFVYEIDPTKGADGFTIGAELEGSNVTFAGIFKN